MTLKKWNYSTHTYDPYEPPVPCRVGTFFADFNQLINCASCGSELKYGDSYSSLEIHTPMGFGYCVCETCHAKEFERRLIYARHPQP